MNDEIPPTLRARLEAMRQSIQGAPKAPWGPPIPGDRRPEPWGLSGIERLALVITDPDYRDLDGYVRATTEEEKMQGFDAWLESPYGLAAEEDALHEEFQETARYWEAFMDWYETNDMADEEPESEVAEAIFVGDSEYADAFDSWIYDGGPK